MDSGGPTADGVFDGGPSGLGASARSLEARAGRLTLGEVWLTIPTMLVLGLAWSSPATPLDFWIHVNNGAWMFEHGAFLARDHLTFTIYGQPVLNQPWLSQLVLYALAATGGYALGQLVIGLVYGLVAALVTRLCLRVSGSPRIAAAMGILGVLLYSNNQGIRSQAFAAALFVLALGILLQGLSRWRSVIALGALEALWANVHGSFPLGVVLPGLFAIGQGVSALRQAGGNSMSEKLLGVGRDQGFQKGFAAVFVTAAAMFVNPNTYHIVLYVLGVTSTVSAFPVDEWLPTWQVSTGIWFFASCGLCVPVIMLSRRRPTATDVLLLAAFAINGAMSQRMVLWWALVMPVVLTPYVAAMAERFVAGRRKDPPRYLNTAFLTVLVAFTVMCTPFTRNKNPLMRQDKRASRIDDAPYDAIAYLKAHQFEGRLFLPMHHAGYASWVLGPKVKVFTDGRLDFFPDSVWKDYFDILYASDDALTLLAQYRVAGVIVDQNSEKSLSKKLTGAKQWKRIYNDDRFSAFSKRPLK